MRIAVLGAGIAGLSAAHFMRDSCRQLDVFEASDKVGGLAASFDWHGFRCDLAPHRFFTDDPAVRDEILSLVPMDLHERRSRIFLRGRWIRDPVNAVEILMKFMPRPSLDIGLQYVFRRPTAEDSFDAMVMARFGKGLNELFFKPYSEKLFGIPADQISPEWGRRKIRVSGLMDMIRRNTRLYFRTFHYPRSGGYGAIADALHARVAGKVRLETSVQACTRLPSGTYRVTFTHGGQVSSAEYDAVVSSVPITRSASFFGKRLKLRFRPADIYFLLVDKPRVSDSHWMYFADSDYCLNRVSEFANFYHRPPVVGRTVLCCEVTATERGSTRRVVEELDRAGLVRPHEVLDSKVIHLPRAYPIYDLASDGQLAAAEAFFADLPGFFNIGRNAEFAHRDIDEIFADARRVASLATDRRPTDPSPRSLGALRQAAAPSASA